MKNPFVFGKVVTSNNFVNRETEKERLSVNITSQINTILISPRRWGKSSLVEATAKMIGQNDDKIQFCFIDLFNIRTEEEFYSTFAKEVLRVSFSKWEEMLDKSKKFFKKLNPRFQIGLDPLTDFSVGFEMDEVKKNPEDILNLPERISNEKNIDLVVCLNEFQNIEFFEDPESFQKKLRASWQNHKLAAYCLYGSKRHLMTQLFENKSMPFYKFGDVMFLNKIEREYWVKFIVSKFKKSNKNITENIAGKVADDMENHPYFVQQLSYNLWNNTEKKCTLKTYKITLNQLIDQQTKLFQREVETLTNSQLNFLKAVCNNVSQLSSAEVIRKYNLGTSANVSRIKQALVNKEVIDITPVSIEFLDPLFKIWFSSVYMK